MSKHLRYEQEGLDAAISILTTAVLGKFYYASDTDETYIGLADGTVVKAGESSAITVYSAVKRVELSGFNLAIPYTTGNDTVLNLSTLNLVSNSLVATVNQAGGLITVPTAGNYKITVNLITNSNNDIFAEVSVLLNGVSRILRTRGVGDGGSTVTKTGTSVATVALSANDVLHFVNDGSDNNTFDTVNIGIELVDQTIISGFNYLTDLTPAVETLTGQTFNGKSVYRQTFDSSIVGVHSGISIVVLNIESVVGQYGLGFTGTRYHSLPFDTGGHVAAFSRIGNDLVLEMIGAFANQPFLISVDYIKQ